MSLTEPPDEHLRIPGPPVRPAASSARGGMIRSVPGVIRENRGSSVLVEFSQNADVAGNQSFGNRNNRVNVP